jgi:hypothetical protein
MFVNVLGLGQARARVCRSRSVVVGPAKECGGPHPAFPRPALPCCHLLGGIDTGESECERDEEEGYHFQTCPMPRFTRQ